MYSVGLIGAGRVGQIRANVIASSNGASLSAVADVDLSRAERIAGVAEARAVRSWVSIVDDPNIDAVIIATPTTFHAEVAIAALRAGKHVLCEKPLGRNLEEARQMYEAAQTYGRILRTGLNYRHMAHVKKAKELLNAGVLGPLYFLRCRFGHGGRPGYEKEWCTDHALSGGGVLLEQGIHIFDLVRHLLGEPAAVLAQTQRFFWDFNQTEDNGFCLLRTSSGQMAQIHISWTQWVNILELELFGRDGYLRIQGRDGHYGPQKVILGKRQPNHSRPLEEVFEFSDLDDSWKNEWQQFISDLNTFVGSRNEPSNGLDGLHAQQLIDAAYRSSALGTWISVT